MADIYIPDNRREIKILLMGISWKVHVYPNGTRYQKYVLVVYVHKQFLTLTVLVTTIDALRHFETG